MNIEGTRLHPGYLFVLEGIDGAGKTTVCDLVEVLLMQQSFDVVRLREPTSESPWGREIRERSPRGELSPAEELDLFIKDRHWHIQNRILPALESGKVVLMDRYFFATGAYQCTSTGLPWQEILRKNREDIDAPEPDIIFILDISADEGLSRVFGSRAEKNEQFEQYERLVLVRAAYLEMSEQDLGNYVVVDAKQDLEQVVEFVYKTIHTYILEKQETEK
ncbi:MAG: dTMP kinase [Candidatus Thorarchaeota archaeon]